MLALELAANGEDIAKAAKATGYGYKAAQKLSRDPRVRVVIEEQRKVVATAAGIDLARCMRELEHLATYNVADAWDDDGNLLPIKQWPESLQRACAGMKVRELFRKDGEDGEPEIIVNLREVKHAGKTDAIDKILRVLGAYAPEKHQHTVSFFDACLGLRGGTKGEAA